MSDVTAGGGWLLAPVIKDVAPGTPPDTAGDPMVLFGYNPTLDQWSHVDVPWSVGADADAVWTSDGLFVWGGFRRDRRSGPVRTGAIFRPRS